MDRKTVGKLQLAFWNGYEVPAACIYAGITQDAYEKAIASDEDLAHRMAVAQLYPKVKAKVELVRRIASGDGRLARHYLETHEPERYNAAYIAKFGRASDDD
jgi:hypothetical protein